MLVGLGVRRWFVVHPVSKNDYILAQHTKDNLVNNWDSGVESKALKCTGVGDLYRVIL